MTWKVAGNLGGESAPDKVRTFFNEGGLYGERAGWHLPGFDDSQWQVRSPTDGLPPGRAGGGVGFFRTTFNLNLPTDHDVALGVRFPSASDSESALGGPGRSQGKYRAQLYVNGWQLGKRVAHLGPQTYFPVPQGILDYKGENTIAISLWALDGKTEDRKLENPLEIEVEARWRGAAAPVVRTNNPGWKELRGKKGH